MSKWSYRKIKGYALGRLVVGYERRDYQVTISLPMIWPKMWRDADSYRAGLPR